MTQDEKKNQSTDTSSKLTQKTLVEKDTESAISNIHVEENKA